MSDQLDKPNEPKEVIEAPASQDPIIEKAALKQRIQDSLMGKRDEPTTETPDEPKEEPKEVIEDVPPVEEPEVEETPEVKKPTGDLDEDELDLDVDPDSTPDEEVEEEDVQDDLDKNIVALRKKHTELNEKHQAQEEVLNDTLNELEKTKEELEKYTYTKIDPKSHPDFVNKREATENALYSGLLRLKGVPNAADKIGKEWGDVLTDVYDYENTPREEKSQALNDLRMSVATRLGMVDEGVDSLDPSIDMDAIDAADSVIEVFERRTGDYKELSDTYERIQSKAADKTLEIGYDEYQSNTESVRQSLAMIDTLSTKDIEEDPTSIQSLAAKKIASSPEFKARAAKIDKMLIELGFGAEALSQEELDRHSKAGKDMDEFHKAREARVTNSREKYLPMMKSLMVMLPQIKEALPQYFEDQDKSEKSKAQKQAVRQSTSKPKAEPEKKEETATRESLRANLRKNLGM